MRPKKIVDEQIEEQKSTKQRPEHEIGTTTIRDNESRGVKRQWK